MTATAHFPPARRARTARRLAVYLGAAILTAVDLTAKQWAAGELPGRSISLGLIDLQLAYNPGVSFSLGASLPAWAIIALTAIITAGVAVAAWRISPRAGLAQRIGLAAVLGGAAANLIDRTLNGHVTDYLHTGWWPTFNLADVFIVLGAFTFAIGYLRAAGEDEKEPARERTGTQL